MQYLHAISNPSHSLCGMNAAEMSLGLNKIQVQTYHQLPHRNWYMLEYSLAVCKRKQGGASPLRHASYGVHMPRLARQPRHSGLVVVQQLVSCTRAILFVGCWAVPCVSTRTSNHNTHICEPARAPVHGALVTCASTSDWLGQVEPLLTPPLCT